jgi:hypothetical protein
VVISAWKRSPELRKQAGKIPSPPRDPRRATGPDDYGVKDSKPSKQKLCKRRQDSDPATALQAEFDKRQWTEEFFHAVNRQAEGKPLSVALQAARDEPSKKAAPLGAILSISKASGEGF